MLMNTNEYRDMSREEKNSLKCEMCKMKADMVLKEGGLRTPVCAECSEEFYPCNDVEDILPI